MSELKRFFTSPVFQDDEEGTRRANVLSTILLSLVVVYVLAGFAVLFVFVQRLGSLLVLVVLLATLLVSRYLMQRRRIQFASILLVSGMWAGITLFVPLAGGMTSIGAAYYIMITVIAGLLLGTRVAVGVAVVCSLTGLVMVVVEGLGYPLPRVFPVPARAGWLHLTFGLSLATIALNITLRSLHDALSLARQQLEERKKAEGALWESEARYRRLFEDAVLGIFQSTPEGKVITVNPAFARMFGYESPKDVIATVKNVATDVFADPQRRSEIMRLIAERPNLRTFENLYRRKDGSTFPGTLHVWPVRDADGRLLHLEGFIEDITERKQAEEVLRESEERHRSLFENSPISLWEEDFSLVKEYLDDLRAKGVTDLRAFFENRPEAVVHCAGLVKVLDVNKATVALVGARDKDELLAGLLKILADEALVVFREELITLAEGGQWFESEEVHRTLSGEERSIVLNLSVAPGYASSLGKVLVSVLDITERKRAEARLERALRETRVRFEVGQALAGAETEDEVLDVLIQRAGLYSQAFASIVTFDRTGGEPTGIVRRRNSFESGLGLIPPADIRFPASRYPLLYRLLSSDRPFVSNDILADEKIDPSFRERARQTGTGSFAAIPLTAGNEWLGLIIVSTKPAGYFDEEKLHLYQTLAEQGAVALRAARLRETIRESQQRLSLLVQQSPLAVIEWNTDFQVVSWNPAAERIFGYTREEVLGCHAAGFIAPEATRPLVDQLWRDLLVQQGGTHSVNDNLTKDGRLITCEWFNSLLAGADGKAIGIASLVEDITQRKQAEEALQESEEKFRTFTESAPVAIMIYQDYHCVYANPEAEQITGCTHQELEQVRFFDFVHPDYKDMSIEAGKALERGESPPYKADFKIIAKNGDEKWLDGRLEMIDYAGKRAALISAMDITERKRAEEALHESEERYRRLAEAAHDMIFIINREGNVDYVNSFATQQLGRLPGEIIGKSHAELFPSGDAEHQQVGLRQVLEAGQPLYIENLTQFPNRRMWLGTWLVPIKDEAGQAKSILGVSRDITERKQAEEEIQRLNAELEQRVVERTAQLEASNKELEAFSYSVSHDLRAPLRALDGFTRILMEDYAPQFPSEAGHYLKTIRESSQQMGRLIDGLLAFSRLSRLPLSKQPVSSADLVRQALDSLSSEQEGRQVEISLGALPPCEGDPTLLRQVWVNLLSNALKFTRGREVARIEVGCVDQEGESVYYVQDNGAGFDMQYASKLFGVFQRLHREDEFEGTGIGLATVQRIILRHGGRIWAEGQVDQGATFYFAI